jgi:hypothetical protein
MHPVYIHQSVFNKETISHNWNDWDPYELIPNVDNNTVQSLNNISLIGILSFVVGCIEWVTYRCSYDTAYRLPYEYIEAFWVFLSGLDSLVPDETTEDDRWEGALDGPINLVLGKFYTTNHTFDFGGSPLEAALCAQVALHVLADKEPFLLWQENVLKRLQDNYPCDRVSIESKMIPQQILDPNFDFRQTETKSLIKTMLSGIDYSLNRFLLPNKKQIEDYCKQL